MSIKVTHGGSPEDPDALHFSYFSRAGLGSERTLAIYFPSTNILEVHPECENQLPGILEALRTYRATRGIKTPGPVMVAYW